MKSINQHINTLLSKYKDMQSLCQPIFSKTSFIIVNYIRIFKKNRKVFYLCDNYEWLEHYLLSCQFQNGAFETNSNFWQQEVTTWDLLSQFDPVMIYSRERFNIYSGITLMKKYGEEIIDFFNFGSNSHNQFDLIKEISILNNFIANFYQKAQRLIAISHKENLFLTPNKKLKKLNFLNKNKRLYLGPHYNYHYLTEKEQLIINHLTQGLNSRDIAKIHKNSIKTIENHITNIKYKLNCRTLFEMGFKLQRFIN